MARACVEDDRKFLRLGSTDANCPKVRTLVRNDAILISHRHALPVELHSEAVPIGIGGAEGGDGTDQAGKKNVAM